MLVPDTIPMITEEMIDYAKRFNSKDDVRNYFGIYDKETVKKGVGCSRGQDCSREILEITGLENEQIAHFQLKYACKDCKRNNEFQEPVERTTYRNNDESITTEIIKKEWGKEDSHYRRNRINHSITS